MPRLRFKDDNYLHMFQSSLCQLLDEVSVFARSIYNDRVSKDGTLEGKSIYDLVEYVAYFSDFDDYFQIEKFKFKEIDLDICCNTGLMYALLKYSTAMFGSSTSRKNQARSEFLNLLYTFYLRYYKIDISKYFKENMYRCVYCKTLNLALDKNHLCSECTK